MDFRMRSQGQVHGWMIGRLYVTFVFEAYSFEMHLMSCKITMKFITVTSFSIFSKIFCFTIVVHFFTIDRYDLSNDIKHYKEMKYFKLLQHVCFNKTKMNVDIPPFP